MLELETTPELHFGFNEKNGNLELKLRVWSDDDMPLKDDRIMAKIWGDPEHAARVYEQTAFPKPIIWDFSKDKKGRFFPRRLTGADRASFFKSSREVRFQPGTSLFIKEELKDHMIVELEEIDLMEMVDATPRSEDERELVAAALKASPEEADGVFEQALKDAIERGRKVDDGFILQMSEEVESKTAPKRRARHYRLRYVSRKKVLCYPSVKSDKVEFSLELNPTYQLWRWIWKNHALSPKAMTSYSKKIDLGYRYRMGTLYEDYFEPKYKWGLANSKEFGGTYNLYRQYYLWPMRILRELGLQRFDGTSWRLK